MSKNFRGNLNKPFQQNISNVWNQHTQSYSCLCPNQAKHFKMIQQTDVCYRCGRQCHISCLWPRESKQLYYQCPMCFLLNCLPNKQVYSIIFAGFLRQSKKDKIQYKINLPEEDRYKQGLMIEARCVRLCKDSKYQINWPSNCCIYINSKKIMEFKPLNTNSSLKKRTDDQVSIDKRNLNPNHNILVIEQKHQHIEGYRTLAYENHFILIAEVQRLKLDLLAEKMMKRLISAEQSKKILENHFHKGTHDCVIDKINISLKCQLYNKKMSHPARSIHCTSHYQPFDLKSFLAANINVKSSSKRWRCPICRERAYDLSVDEHLMNILKANPKIDTIQFSGNNMDSFMQIQQGDDEQQSIKSVSKYQQIESQPQIVNSGEGVIRKDKNKSFLYQEYIEIQSDVDININKQQKQQEKINFFNELSQQKLQITNMLPQKKRKQSQKIQANPLAFIRNKSFRFDSSPALDQAVPNQLIQQSEMQIQILEDTVKNEQKFKQSRNLSNKIREENHKMSASFITSSIDLTSLNFRSSIPTIQQASRKQNKMESAIQIESDDQNEQQIKETQLKYHKQQLKIQKMSLMGRNQKCQITAADQDIFLSLCQRILMGSIRGY